MPGLEADWELFDIRKLRIPWACKDVGEVEEERISGWIQWRTFHPGYHTVEQFKETPKLLKSYGIDRHNTYNLHMNDWVVKNLFKLGLDPEKDLLHEPR